MLPHPMQLYRRPSASEILYLEKYDDDRMWCEGMVLLCGLEFAQNSTCVLAPYFLRGHSLSSAVCPQAYTYHDPFSLDNITSCKGENHAIGQDNGNFKRKHVWELQNSSKSQTTGQQEAFEHPVILLLQLREARQWTSAPWESRRHRKGP